VRCGRCGNENSEGNRFCGMCGASLVKTQVAAPAAPVADTLTAAAVTRAADEARLPARPANAAVPVAAPPVATAPPVTRPNDTPSSSSGAGITGPSFLGLNRPADGRSGLDPVRQGSGNLDYLLEDEEEPRRGWGKLAVVVIALGLIGGFGYLRWKQGGFNFLKTAPATQSSQNPPDAAGSATASPDAGAANPANANAANPDSANQNPANKDSANPGAASQNPATPDAGASGAAPTPPASGTAPGGTETGAQQATPASASTAQGTPAENAAPAKPQDDASAKKPTESEPAEDAEAAPAKPESHVRAADSKPSAARKSERKPTPATPVDLTAEAERYIYGRGVGQDCDHGLRLLKPAAAQANPKAMIALGTLYSIGTCTPRDLPTAYRWFALALHKQPDNQPLQDDLQKLWSQMTQPERQLAIKLSQ
jgi:TPR repeat protein